MQLVMFDIDGTLVDSKRFDGNLFAEAIWNVSGRTVDTTWNSYRHVTDSGILEEVLGNSTSEHERDVLWKEIKNEFVGLTKNFLSRNPDVVTEIPGARALISRLRELPHIQIAIATGGWRETAQLKLDAVGIEYHDLPLATASDAMSRVEIMQLAEQRSALHGPLTRKWYFGDAAWDKHASRELGYEFVAVGTQVEHRVAFPDLTDLPGILAVLGLSE